jgi:hypothetical protein
LSAIFLLSHLLPYATGTDFYLLQNLRRKDDDNSYTGTATSHPEDYVLRMPLEDRLDQTPILALSSNQYGDDEFGVTDPDVDLSLNALLDTLALLLQQRQASYQQVDLLHLFAMMIHPYHPPNSIPKFSLIFKKSPAVLKAARLMENVIGLQFQIHYGHRRQVVDLIHKHLVVPEMCNEYGAGIGPLIAGALPHLRCSLRCFARAAETAQDAHLALAASAHVVAQCRNYRLYLKSEWEFLLHHMVDDRADYNCQGKCHCPRSQNLTVGSFLEISDDNAPQLPADAFFCPHSSRGRLLADFIARSSRSRRDADPQFVSTVTSSLSEAIEWQVDHWTVHSEDESDNNDEDKNRMHSTCLLASLVCAAHEIFHLQSAESSQEDDDPYATLIRCSVQLLRHSDRGIVYESTRLLIEAFSSANFNKVDEYSSLLLASVRMCLQENHSASTIEKLVAVCSNQSPSFAVSFFKMLWAELDASSHEAENVGNLSNQEVYRWLTAAAVNCPTVASHHRDRIARLLVEAELAHECQLQAALALLYSRLGRYFPDANSGSALAVGDFLRAPHTNNWELYLMARSALLSGNYGVAMEAVQRLTSC